MKQYNHIILGGTFDYFHAGHEHMIRTACIKATHLTIGVTTPAMLKTKLLYSSIQDYDTRLTNVRNFINKITPYTQCKFIPLSNIYGTSLKDKTVEAIVVTHPTKKGAVLINKKRKKLGMRPLDIIITTLIKGDDNRTISSERIRYGDIDRKGKNYYKRLVGKKKWSLPDKLRPILREPLGDVISGDISYKKSVVNNVLQTIRPVKPSAIFAIGDIIVESLYEFGVPPSVSIVDSISRREAVEEVQISNIKSQILRRYRNRAGTIEREAVSQIKLLRDRYMNTGIPQVLGIRGEEDLLALPSILLAPLGSVILYGQYNLGVVIVKVTEGIKEKIMVLLDRFTP